MISISRKCYSGPDLWCNRPGDSGDNSVRARGAGRADALSSIRHCPKKTAVDMRRWKHCSLDGGGIVVVADVLGCLTRTIERGAIESRPAFPTIRRWGACGVLVAVEKKIAAEPELERESEVRVGGPHRRRPRRGTDRVDRVLADPNCRTGRREGHAGQSARRARSWLAEEGLALHKIAEGRGRRSGRPIARLSLQRIAALKAAYLDGGNPVFSMDTKAKERLGQLDRKGRVWTRQAFPRRRFDHDFPSWATGLVIPHGIYDLGAQLRPRINIGLSHDTSAFACDSFRWYWNCIGQRCYASSTRRRSCCCATVVAAMPPISTSSSRTCKSWSTPSASRSAWLITQAIARSTTRLNAVSFRMSAPALPAACCSTLSTPWSA